MYRIYVTDGVVLSRHASGEATVSLALLTRDLGLVRTSARSARVEKSKLRYGLQLLTTGRYSLVRGKHEWRLTGVERVSRDLVATALPRRAALGRISKLLLRLVAGEEPIPLLFDVVQEGFLGISQAKIDAEAEAVECVVVLRVLALLGYLPHREILASFVEGPLLSTELIEAAIQSRNMLIKTINESLSASGL